MGTGLVHDDEILNSIVDLVAVFMMNVLPAIEPASKVLLHNQPMFTHADHWLVLGNSRISHQDVSITVNGPTVVVVLPFFGMFPIVREGTLARTECPCTFVVIELTPVYQIPAAAIVTSESDLERCVRLLQLQSHEWPPSTCFSECRFECGHLLRPQLPAAGALCRSIGNLQSSS